MLIRGLASFSHVSSTFFSRGGLRLLPNYGWVHFGLGKELEGKDDVPGALGEYCAACMIDSSNVR